MLDKDDLEDDNQLLMTRQNLYDCIRNSQETADSDLEFLTEMNLLIDKKKNELGFLNRNLAK